MIQFAELLTCDIYANSFILHEPYLHVLNPVEVFPFIPYLCIVAYIERLNELFCVPKNNHCVSKGKHDFNWYGNKYVVGMSSKMAFIDLNNTKTLFELMLL